MPSLQFIVLLVQNLNLGELQHLDLSELRELKVAFIVKYTFSIRTRLFDFSLDVFQYFVTSNL